ncbi:hypothetical protein E3U43_021589 [Larimichthys crocea]|uniref:Uncharacterized protein n=1 Tax=Larimichthys crocea TaxID=215358 RepID=A0ACD3R6C4_LARCR|nr:hypothetical protein E3U43_021589 [Larimichthys crocea]
MLMALRAVYPGRACRLLPGTVLQEPGCPVQTHRLPERHRAAGAESSLLPGERESVAHLQDNSVVESTLENVFLIASTALVTA